mgnify:CR=1 FL=1|jgi:hypothetical protein
MHPVHPYPLVWNLIEVGQVYEVTFEVVLTLQVTYTLSWLVLGTQLSLENPPELQE